MLYILVVCKLCLISARFLASSFGTTPIPEMPSLLLHLTETLNNWKLNECCACVLCGHYDSICFTLIKHAMSTRTYKKT